MIKQATIQKGQTFADMAIQETGWFEGLFDLALSNNLSCTEELAANSTIDVYPDDINELKLTRVKKENIEPATLFNYSIEGEDPPVLGGIEYMAIQIDFIVS